MLGSPVTAPPPCRATGAAPALPGTSRPGATGLAACRQVWCWNLGDGFPSLLWGTKARGCFCFSSLACKCIQIGPFRSGARHDISEVMGTIAKVLQEGVGVSFIFPRCSMWGALLGERELLLEVTDKSCWLFPVLCMLQSLCLHSVFLPARDLLSPCVHRHVGGMDCKTLGGNGARVQAEAARAGRRAREKELCGAWGRSGVSRACFGMAHSDREVGKGRNPRVKGHLVDFGWQTWLAEGCSGQSCLTSSFILLCL